MTWKLEKTIAGQLTLRETLTIQRIAETSETLSKVYNELCFCGFGNMLYKGRSHIAIHAVDANGEFLHGINNRIGIITE